jgi:hypothetical protein
MNLPQSLLFGTDSATITAPGNMTVNPIRHTFTTDRNAFVGGGGTGGQAAGTYLSTGADIVINAAFLARSVAIVDIFGSRSSPAVAGGVNLPTNFTLREIWNVTAASAQLHQAFAVGDTPSGFDAFRIAQGAAAQSIRVEVLDTPGAGDSIGWTVHCKIQVIPGNPNV